MDNLIVGFNELLFKGAYVAGGAVLSRVTKQKISDYDIYPKSRSAALGVISSIFSDHGGQLVSISDRALTFKCNDLLNVDGERMVIQVMIFDWEFTTQKIFEYFDFTVCMAAYDLDAMEFVFHEHFWIDVASRTLRFNSKTKFPLNTLIRTIKYQKKGYTLPYAQAINIGLRISKENISSWDELASAIGGTYGKVVSSRAFFPDLGVNDPIPEFDLSVASDILYKFSELAVTESVPLSTRVNAINRVADKFPEDYPFSKVYFAKGHIVDPVKNEIIPGLSKKEMIDTGFFVEEDFVDHLGFVIGYKVLIPKDDHMVNAVHSPKSTVYKIGEVTSADDPHLFVFPTLDLAKKNRYNSQEIYEVDVVANNIIDISDGPSLHDNVSTHFRATKLYVRRKVDLTEAEPEKDRIQTKI